MHALLERPQATDGRFRRLLPAPAWDALPEAARRRFSEAPAPGRCILYRGRTLRLRLNFAGRIFVALGRLVGAPLPLDEESDGRDAVVAIADDGRGAQTWTRLYARRGFPQAISSTKRFVGATLEEHVVDGRLFGLGMRLDVDVVDGALFFRSRDYFVRLLNWRSAIPRRLRPGVLTIGHHDLGARRFLFTLTLVHPTFGLMIDQEILFHDMEAACE